MTLSTILITVVNFFIALSILLLTVIMVLMIPMMIKMLIIHVWAVLVTGDERTNRICWMELHGVNKWITSYDPNHDYIADMTKKYGPPPWEF